jgi:hypothetical protein
LSGAGSRRCGGVVKTGVVMLGYLELAVYPAIFFIWRSRRLGGV